MEKARVTYYGCISFKKDSLLVYVLKFFQILAGRCCSVVVREKVLGYERSGFDPGLRLTFLLIEILSITGQKCSNKCLKNGSNRLRKGTLPQLTSAWTMKQYLLYII